MGNISALVLLPNSMIIEPMKGSKDIIAGLVLKSGTSFFYFRTTNLGHP